MPRKRVMIVSSVLFILIACGVFVFFAIYYFTVSTVVIYGERDILGNTSSIQHGYNILLLNTKAVEEQLKQDNPLIKNIAVIKKLPYTLEIHYEKRIGQIALRNADAFYLVDADGFIVTQTSNIHNLPILNIASVELSAKEGNITDTNVVKGIQLLIKVADAGFPVTTAEYSPDRYELTIHDGKLTIVIPINYDQDMLSSSLQLLARQFRIEGKQPVYIDFRFEKPIIRF